MGCGYPGSQQESEPLAPLRPRRAAFYTLMVNDMVPVVRGFRGALVPPLRYMQWMCTAPSESTAGHHLARRLRQPNDGVMDAFPLTLQ